MSGAPAVVLDACVLASFSLCDTLLRLAEPPPLFEPKWSEQIMRETTRTLKTKLGWPSSLTEYFESELVAHFKDAWISGYDALVSRMPNDQNDRHVLAAAVHGKVPLVLTFNLRHFRTEDLEPWGIRALHPQTFMCGLYQQESVLVLAKLQQQATDRRRTLERLLEILKATVPEFVRMVSASLPVHNKPNI